MTVKLHIPAAALALALLVSGGLVSGEAASAAERPSYDIGTALREAAPRKPPAEAPQEAPVLPELEDEQMVLPDGQTIFIRGFRLEDAEFIDETVLLNLLEPYRNRELSLSEIYEAANRITSHYRTSGYMMAKAFVPKQDASAGILTIRVSVGRHGAFQMENSSGVWDFLVEGTFADSLAAGRPVSRPDVERAMMLVADMPGARMPKLTIAPGAAPGTTDFLVQVERAERFGGYVMADNFGSRYTGRERLMMGLDINSPLGMADKLALSGITTEAAGLQSGRLAYAFPLYHDGLRAEVAVARTTYKLSDTYKALDATGVANSFEGTLSYPIKRTQDETVVISLGGAHKRLRDKSAGAYTDPRSAQVGTLAATWGTNGSLFGMRTSTALQSSASLGYLDFVNSSEEIANRNGANTAGVYSKFNLGASGSLGLTDKWSLNGAFRGQKALQGKNLDGSEQIGISGSSGVQVYPEGVSSDNGYLASSELQYALPELGDFQHTLGLFFELGRIYIQNGTYKGTAAATQLSDVGLAYYANFAYQDGKYLTAALRAVHVLGPQQPTGERSSKGKILGQVGFTF
jgi:hemolysin activation/secretion protein